MRTIVQVFQGIMSFSFCQKSIQHIEVYTYKTEKPMKIVVAAVIIVFRRGYWQGDIVNSAVSKTYW